MLDLHEGEKWEKDHEENQTEEEETSKATGEEQRISFGF